MNEIVDFNLSAGILLNFIIYLILMYMGWQAWKKPKTVKLVNFNIFLLLLLVVSVFSYTGDFYHYYSIFTKKQSGKGYLQHIEYVYLFILNLTEGEYYLWRFLTWGISIILITLTCKILKLNPFITWFVFLSYGMIFFVNGRVSLSMAIFFLGIALMVRNRVNLFIRILGIALIIASTFFHKSAGFGVIILLLSLILFRFNKFTIGAVIIAIPLLILLLKLFLTNIFTYTLGGDASLILNTAQGYLKNEEFETRGIGRLIQLTLLWSDFVLWFVLIIKAVKSKIYNRWPFQIRIFVNFVFFTLILSSLFFFDLGFPTKILQLRFSEFAFIPAAIMVASCRMCNFNNKITKWVIYLGIAQCIYNFIYTLYLSFTVAHFLK